MTLAACQLAPRRLERWRQVPEFPAYEVSSAARVRRISTGKVLKPHFVFGGYPVVSLRRDGQTFKRMTDRLRAAAFGNLREDEQLDHRRGKAASRAEIVHGSRVRKHSSSYKGVSFVRARGRWYASIRHRGKTRAIGFFDNECEAAKAYDCAARKQWGPAAFQNFARP
jgi:hypothetical protein